MHQWTAAKQHLLQKDVALTVDLSAFLQHDSEDEGRLGDLEWENHLEPLASMLFLEWLSDASSTPVPTIIIFLAKTR